MGHDCGNHSARFTNGEHMLGEHEVAFFARGRTPAPAETLGVLHIVTSVVLAEGRIRDNAIETLELARLSMHRMEQRVLELYVCAGNTVQ